MKRLIAIAASVAVTGAAALSLAGPASASDETATVDLQMTAQSGKLSKTDRTPVNWKTSVEIKAPASSPKVSPMKNVRVTFPKDMAFNPDKSVPVCPDDQVGPPPTNLSLPPDTIIPRCPNSVLGNGTAGLYLAQSNSPSGPTLKDPVLIVFNGGTDSSGKPKIKIYGFSQQTGAGIFMSGVLDNGVLDIAIPRLTFDSGTGDFNLNIPGSAAPQTNRRGVDKGYVTAKCSTGEWLTNATFTLGSRDSGGNPVGGETTVNAPQDTTDCVGEDTGKGKVGSVKIKGPGKVKKGKKGTYKVTVKNTGTGSISSLKVSASGKGAKGSASGGTLAAGKSKTVKVKVKFSKKGKIKTTFKATGKNVSAKSAKKTVKVN